MKKFTFILVAVLLSSMAFAQFQLNTKQTPNAPNQQVEKAYVATLQWCAEDNTQGIGTDGAGTLACAAEFDATDLASYDGNYITKIFVGIADASVITSGKVAILTGTAAAPVVAYEQTATFVDGWNEILLTVPYAIDGATPIFVAYELVVTGGYPLGFDAGPETPKGNYINTTGFTGAFSHLTELAPTLTYNCSIKAEVDDEAGGAIIGASPSVLNFIGFVGEGSPATQTVVVAGVSLTADIDAVVTGPFEISIDDVTYGTTAILPVTGGDLFVKYLVADAGSFAGDITLTSTGADEVIVTLAGATVDCSTVVTAPYTEDFTSTPVTACWTITDVNADGSTFSYYWSDASETDLAIAYSYSGTNNADDWAISPKFTVPNAPVANIQAKVQSATYGEKFEIYAWTGTDADYATGTIVLAEQSIANEEWATFDIDLTAFIGDDVHLGIKATSDADMWMLWFDDLVIDEGVGVINAITSNISVFPNPANNVITVANAENTNITVVNMMGQVVSTVENASANQTIDISNLANGSYFVRVNSEVFKINVVK